MIISLPELKRALGLDPEDASEDEALTELVTRIVSWVEGQTKKRFSTPIEVTEYRLGSGRRKLFVEGRIAGPAAEDPDYVYITVSERFALGDWEVLVEGEDYERRDNALIRLDDWAWPPNAEYKLVYHNGYHESEVPEDIQALVIEMAAAQYGADAAAASGEAGISSEKIGDYSYSLDASAVVGASGGGSVSDTGMATLNRYKRKLV